MLSKTQKQKALCVLLLVAGFALCIGAIWMPVLLAAGIPILTAGLGVAADMYDSKDRYTINYYINQAASDVANDLSPQSKKANDRRLALKVIARLKAITPAKIKENAIAAVISKPSIIVAKDASPEIKEAMKQGMTLLFNEEGSRQEEEEEEECKRVSPKANTLNLG